MSYLVKHIKHFIKTIKQKELVPIAVPVDTNKILEGKIALITGGNSGIGYAIAESFLKSGCKVIIAGTNEEKLLSCKNKLEKDFAGGIETLVLNVLDVDSMPDKIIKAASAFEEKRIDILVNSAGVVAKHKFMEIGEQEYDSIMNVNAKGTFFMCQAMGKYMIENNIKGHILNVTSSSALRPAWTPYQMSKWAVRGFTLGLADTLLPHGIIVNAIAPGPVATPMLGKGEGDSIHSDSFPMGRYGVPSEVAALATFMVSDFGNLIVGDTYYMTGGSGVVTLHH